MHTDWLSVDAPLSLFQVVMLDKLNAIGKGLTQTLVAAQENGQDDRIDEIDGNEEEEETENDEQFEGIKKLITENITLKKQLEAVNANVCTFSICYRTQNYYRKKMIELQN